MAKAVLVIDMPECCADCACSYFERDSKELNLICGATGEDANNVGKPDWCPLRELPEKKVADKRLAISPLTEGHLNDFERGWNACLDAILHK